MLGPDALILLRDKNSSSFSSVHSCLRCHGVLLHLCQRLSDRSWHENATGWMTLGQFSEIFFMLALPFSPNALVSKVLLLGLVTAAIRYGFFIYGSADEYFTYALFVPRHFAARRKLRFYYVTAYIYVDKSPVHMRTAAQG